MRLPDTFPTDLVVLVADDDAFARTLLRKMLEGIGIANVLLANDGDEALALFASGMTRIDVVISDLHMPKRNGFELFEAVRTIDPSMPFLLVTGDARERAVAEARAREISAYVVKPLSPAQLQEKLVATLQRDPNYANRIWPRTAEGLEFRREASEMMKALFDGWRAGRTDGSMPSANMLNRLRIERQARFDQAVFTVDIELPGPRLRYSYVGSDIVAKFGRDPTGEYIDEQTYLHRRYALPAYERVMQTRTPHYRFVKGIEGLLLLRYKRLLLPFGDAGGVKAVLGYADIL